jgi:hypothetical protein
MTVNVNSFYADVFPAFVSITPPDVGPALEAVSSSPPSEGSYQISIARAVIRNGMIFVAQDGPQGPVVVFSEPIDPTTLYKAPDTRLKDSYVQTVSGKKIAFKKDSACGCGSRLRSWSPTKFATSIKDPS